MLGMQSRTPIAIFGHMAVPLFLTVKNLAPHLVIALDLDQITDRSASSCYQRFALFDAVRTGLSTGTASNMMVCVFSALGLAIGTNVGTELRQILEP